MTSTQELLKFSSLCKHFSPSGLTPSQSSMSESHCSKYTYNESTDNKRLLYLWCVIPLENICMYSPRLTHCQFETFILVPFARHFSVFYRFLKMWTIFKVLIEFITILFLFHALVFQSRGMDHLSSPTRERTCTPCTEGEVSTTGLLEKSTASPKS